MASIHVLEGSNESFRVVCHATTPAGNNSVGNSWANCVVASGQNTTVMPTGSGLGQITSAEAAEIAAGTKVEFVFQIPVPTAGTLVQRRTALEETVNQKVTDELAALQSKYRYYGHTKV